MPGKINITAATYELIKDEFDCEYRGNAEIPGNGMIEMYFVNGYKSPKIKSKKETIPASA